MRKLVVSVAAILCGAGTAVADNPKWCKDGDWPITDEDVNNQLKSKDVIDQLHFIARTMCQPSNASVQKYSAEIGQLRDHLGRDFGLQGDDWADVVDFRGGNALGLVTDLGGDYSSKNLMELSPIEQYRAIVQGFTSEEAEKYGGQLYAADAFGSRLTQLGHAAAIYSCLNTYSDEQVVVGAAICAEDVSAFDANKAFDEIRSDPNIHPDMRMLIRVVIHDLAAWLAHDLPSLEQKFFRKDSEYKRMFDVATAARADWTKAVGAKADLLELTAKLDSAMFFKSRKLKDGCERPTADALAAAVSSIPAKAFATARDVRNGPGFASKAAQIFATNPAVFLAGVAYFNCQVDTPTSQYLKYVYRWVPGLRGPRSAAFTAIMGGPFKFDDTTKNRVDMPPSGGTPFTISSGGAVGMAQQGNSWGGVVHGLKPAGKQTQVILEKVMVQEEDCIKEHQSDHFVGIRNDGSLIYPMICDQTANVMHDISWKDVVVNSEQAKKWLKPGVVFSATTEGDDGEVIAVWPNKSALLPSMVLGGHVK